VKKICETERLRIYLQPISFIKTNKQMRRDIFKAIADQARLALIVSLHSRNGTTYSSQEFQHFPASGCKAVTPIKSVLTYKTKTSRHRNFLPREINKMKEIEKWLEQFKKIKKTVSTHLSPIINN